MVTMALGGSVWARLPVEIAIVGGGHECFRFGTSSGALKGAFKKVALPAPIS